MTPDVQPKKEQLAASNTVTQLVSSDIAFEIGDAKKPDFYPQIKTLHWGNECNFSVRLDDKDKSVAAVSVDDLGAIVWRKGDITVRFRQTAGEGDGGFDMEIELTTKPASNIVSFTLQTKGFDFFYQPALDASEPGAFRPDNVIGSYAVYHATKSGNRIGGKSYFTGKAFHIYRPKARDALGKETWCDLLIDDKSNVMTITVPQIFLDSATYPVVI